jgi:hypothetical protein
MCNLSRRHTQDLRMLSIISLSRYDPHCTGLILI